MNFSTGAWAASVTVTTRPGTIVGTWPETMIWTVDAVLPDPFAEGLSR